ncbi:MAG TPA: extracellular solute-binding protein [Gaiellaceae bacterium]|nr:extracellular solute-binding protein [Gaiellaceae bacterium]
MIAGQARGATRGLRARRWSLAGAAAACLCALVGAAPATPAPVPTLTIWADQKSVSAVTKVAAEWSASSGVAVTVVPKSFGSIQDDLAAAAGPEAPDVTVAANAWTAALAMSGLAVALSPPKPVSAQFPTATLDAFSYGPGTKRLYGIPVSVENIALVVNTKLVKVPKTWSQLEKSALAFKKKHKGNLALAVQQGASGDGYHMYPFFAGLGGYVFGTNAAGTLDPSDLGVANKAFLRNSPLVDRWNRLGLISARVDAGRAQSAFLGGRAAFWVTGPWSIANLEKHPELRVRIVQVPPIAKASVPLLGVQGYMVTKYAAVHGLDAAAKDLVTNALVGTAAQEGVAAVSGRYPASEQAANRVKNRYLAQFGRAGEGGVPWPNIPQMENVWPDLSAAWAKSTRGPSAVKAAAAFRAAARSIAAKIG